MEIAILSIIDKIYPVGCFFDTTDSSFNPNTTFGGTWKRITDASVLMSEGYYEDGQLVTVGNNCGNNNPKIPLGALPAHTHTYTLRNSSTDDHKLTISEIPSHNHAIRNGTNGSDGGGDWTVSNSGASNWYTANTGGGQGHSHTIGAGQGNTGTTGTNNNFAVVQNSLVVCRWHRTA